MPPVMSNIGLVMLGGGLGGVQIWDLPGSSDNCLLRPTGRGDGLRRGYLAP